MNDPNTELLNDIALAQHRLDDAYEELKRLEHELAVLLQIARERGAVVGVAGT